MNTSENANAGLTFFLAFFSGISAFAYKVTWVRFHHQQGVNVRVYPFPSIAGCELEGVSLSINTRCERGGVSLSINNRCERGGVSLSINSWV